MLLPYIIPLLALLLILAGIPNILVYSFLPLAYCGIPYFVFVALAWRWMKNKTPREISTFATLAPVLFIPFQAAFLLLLYMLRDTSISHWFGKINMRDSYQICCFVTLVGYIHVGITFLIWQSLQTNPQKESRIH